MSYTRNWSRHWSRDAFRGWADVAGGLPSGEFEPVNSINYPEPAGSSTALQRYQTNPDGQDDFFLAGFVWSTASAASGFAYSLVGSAAANASINEDLGTDGSGNIIWSSFAGETATLNGVVITSGTTQLVVGEINLIAIVGTYSGSIDRHGANLALTQFYPAAISAVMLIDSVTSANAYTYKLTGNAPYELPIGEELGDELWNDLQTIDPEWTANPDGTYTCDGTQAGNAFMRTDVNAQIGDGYIAGVEIVSILGGNISCRVGTGVAIEQGATGQFEGIAATASTDDNIKVRAEVGVSCVIRAVTFKKLPASHLTFENGEPDGSDRELITRKSDNSGWVGEELWKAPFSSIASEWTDKGDGSYTCDGTQVGAAPIVIDNQVAIGEQVLCGLEVVSVSGGLVRQLVGNDEVNVTATSGVLEGIGATTSVTNIRVIANPGVSCTVRAVTFKKQYNYAAGAIA